MPFGSYHLTTLKKKSRTSKTNRRMPVPLLPQQYLIYLNLIQFIKDQKGDPKWNVEKETLTYQGSLETNQPIRVLQSLHYYNYYPGVHSKQEAQQWRVYPPWTLVEKRTTSTQQPVRSVLPRSVRQMENTTWPSVITRLEWELFQLVYKVKYDHFSCLLNNMNRLNSK